MNLRPAIRQAFVSASKQLLHHHRSGLIPVTVKSTFPYFIHNFIHGIQGCGACNKIYNFMAQCFTNSKLSLLGANSDSDNDSCVDEDVLNSPLLSNAANDECHFEKYCNYF